MGNEPREGYYPTSDRAFYEMMLGLYDRGDFDREVDRFEEEFHEDPEVLKLTERLYDVRVHLAERLGADTEKDQDLWELFDIHETLMDWICRRAFLRGRILGK